MRITNTLRRLLAATLYLSIFTSPAFASDKQIILGNGVISNGVIANYNNADASGSVNKPSTPKGAVLLIHGWSGQMNEVGDMYLRLANQLADIGIASVRINIRGESEREKTNYRLTSTFASRVQDAQIGLDFLQQTYPNLPLGVVGFSLGGATALALTGSHPEVIKSLVLWSSAGDPAVIVTNLDSAIVKEAIDKGEAKYQDWVELTLTREHLLGMLGHDVFTPLKNYKGALLSIRGTEDFVPPQEKKIFENANAAPEDFYLIGGADHIFNTLDPASNFDERIIAHTVRWLGDTLK